MGPRATARHGSRQGYQPLSGHPLVSIIIPTHDRLPTVFDAIESARGQSYRNIEVIVVDDGSPVPLKLQGSPVSNVVVVRHSHRYGPAAARNTGLLHARGELVLFLDDDDQLCPDRIVRGVTQLGHAAAHACSVRITTDTGRSWIDKTRYAGDMRKTRHLPNHPAMGQVLHRREHVLQFDEALRVSEDKEWWIRMAPYACYAWDPVVGLLVHRHTGPRPAVDPETGYRSRLCVYLRHAKSIDRRSRAHLEALVGSAAFESGNAPVAARWAATSLRSFPTKRGVAVYLAAAWPSRKSRDYRSGLDSRGVGRKPDAPDSPHNVA